jgi:hypothetical protein
MKILQHGAFTRLIDGQGRPWRGSPTFIRYSIIAPPRAWLTVMISERPAGATMT